MALLVNGDRIEDAELEHVQGQLLQQIQDGVRPEWEARGIALETFAKDMVIAQVLVRQEARANGPDIPVRDLDKTLSDLKKDHGGPAAFEQFLKNAGRTEADIKQDLELSLKIDRLLDRVCADIVEPAEEEARAYYDAHPAEFEIPERVHAGHIVKNAGGTILDTQAVLSDMEALLEQLRQGGNFEAMASSFSDCSDNGGDLGYFARGAMVPEFEKVVFALKDGEMSDVFQTPFGFHIAKLYDRIPARPRPFEDVVDEVKRVLRGERENAVIDAFTGKLRDQATVEEV